MSLTKRWLEEVSESMGLEGEITPEVMEEAQARAERIQDMEREDQDLLETDDLGGGK